MYKKSIFISLVLIYLVIIAGAVVRMTGSGMGCPDWPKCFGYIIPPTNEAELIWTPEKSYQKGQVIIVDETLRVAKSDFTTGNEFNPQNWNGYDKHSYAIFNPWHTWIEYINRLLGALAGLSFLVTLGIALFKERKFKRIFLSLLAVGLIGFQGWIGATVVYSVLSPVRITIHMVIALLIVALLIYMLIEASPYSKSFKFDKAFKNGMLVAVILTLIQIVLGTQVRQHIDETIDVVGYEVKELWLQNPVVTFYIHRSFSILVLLLNAWLFIRNKRFILGHKNLKWVILLILAEVFTGVLMNYFEFPFLTQPLHLVIASILFGFQFYILLTAFKEKEALSSTSLQ
ncbi:COX15/CtaA family protein [Leeuwenhoekiella parthenopeia]|uniref:COX15/CtaA family protein n=1 Tax=Leeuwenhoekiella parthenopeia TaxID=2890320 RepID=A0ABS8GMH1_9FLAO|nr:COX15/CtaA family protein [Leeuwenhoekiella parthenopeia]